MLIAISLILVIIVTLVVWEKVLRHRFYRLRDEAVFYFKDKGIF